MATYYVRVGGSDAAAGTSPSTAWLTLGKALGASGISSGDVVYVGAGTYRESVTVNMTSATVDTKIIGDVTGVYTGDAPGDVIWTGYTSGDFSVPASTSVLITNARDYLWFENIQFISGDATTINHANNSTNITFYKCGFIIGGTGVRGHMAITTTANVALNLTFDSCVFLKGTLIALTFTLTRPTGADFDYNVQIKKCMFLGGSSTTETISITATGANAFMGGGVDVYNCSRFFSNGAFVRTASANVSTTIPCTVYNCYIYGGATAFTANTAGQIVENYNVIQGGATPRTNVSAGANSIDNTASYRPPLFYSGIEAIQYGKLLPFGMAKIGSLLLGFGNQASSPPVDALGNPRPTGVIKTLDLGKATSGGAATLTNTNRAFRINSMYLCIIKIISGTGAGQYGVITTNTATTITIMNNWATQPDNTSEYEIFIGTIETTGIAIGGFSYQINVTGSWPTWMFMGCIVEITGGTGVGETSVIVSRPGPSQLFVSPSFTVVPDTTTTFAVYPLGVSSLSAIPPSVGCYEGELITPLPYQAKRSRRYDVRRNSKGQLTR